MPMNNEVVVTCAITGSGDTQDKHPNLPITPAQIMPPMAPTRMTSMGTFTPRPRKSGFRKLSLPLTIRLQMRKPTEITVLSLAEKT